MVVCKCRKATKLYCFVHKVPVCGECICFPEHQICVIRTYSEWVIDGEYDWPPKCCHCHTVIDEGTDTPTTRLGCLHVIHTSCLVSHIKDFPPHTAPAGYVCPACSTSIWPTKSVKDSGSLLHSKLKEAIMQTGLEKNLFGNLPVSLPTVESRAPPPAFASNPLIIPIDGREDDDQGNSNRRNGDIVEVVDGLNSEFPSQSSNESNFLSPTGAGATARKSSMPYDRQNSEASYYADDEEANRKKYAKRGPLRHKFLRSLLPFWSSSLPVLPVTAPSSRKDGSKLEDIPETRARNHRSSRMDPRKLLLIIAIMACMATMVILYYRISQPGLDEVPDDELLPQQ